MIRLFNYWLIDHSIDVLIDWLMSSLLFVCRLPGSTMTSRWKTLRTLSCWWKVTAVHWWFTRFTWKTLVNTNVQLGTWTAWRTLHADWWLNVSTLTKRLITTATRKLCYRKDDRAMPPIGLHGCPENFRVSLTTPTATIPNIFMGFCSDRLYECSYKIWSP